MLYSSPGRHGNQTMHSTPLPHSTRLRPDSDRLFSGLGPLLASNTNASLGQTSLSDEGYASLNSILTPSELMQRIPSYLRHHQMLANHHDSLGSKPLTELVRDSYHDHLKPMDSIFNGHFNEPNQNPFSRGCVDLSCRPTCMRSNPRLTASAIQNENHYGPEIHQQISQICEPIIYQAFLSKLNTAFGSPRNLVNPIQKPKTAYTNPVKSAFQPNPANLNLFSIDNLIQSSQAYKPILVQLRQEMIHLIDSIIQQLDSHFAHNPLPQLVSNMLRDDSETLPLNLKSPPNLFSNLNKIYSNKDDKISESESCTSSVAKINLEQPIQPKFSVSNGAPKCSPKKSLQTLGLVRRFKRFGSSLRSSKSRRLRIRQIAREYLQEQTKMVANHGSAELSLNESLDLRIHKQSAETDRLNFATTGLGSSTDCKRPNEDSIVKFTTLSAHHLKKAKLMFMYSRYPHSNLLKSYFPDMVFNRSTTAQLVKWFSNFREFFYLQIEKFVRQAKAAGLTKPDQIDLVKNPELIQSMELHFNKGGEIPTPKEFINAIHTAVQEFAEAILNGQDMNPTWRKAIYKKICLLDIIFPPFFKQI